MVNIRRKHLVVAGAIAALIFSLLLFKVQITVFMGKFLLWLIYGIWIDRT